MENVTQEERGMGRTITGIREGVPGGHDEISIGFVVAFEWVESKENEYVKPLLFADG